VPYPSFHAWWDIFIWLISLSFIVINILRLVRKTSIILYENNNLFIVVKPWTRTEHQAFLKGLEAVGKGKWKRISKDFVVTKTPTQVASHAQKHFNYRRGAYNNKNRTSVFDMKLVSFHFFSSLYHWDFCYTYIMYKIMTTLLDMAGRKWKFKSYWYFFCIEAIFPQL